jgi:hypothetical protein
MALHFWNIKTKSAMNLQTYSVRKGKNDFSPPEFPTLILFGKRTPSWTFTIEANCWYDSLGADNLDWNKLGGITRAISANNIDSLLIGWRPLPTEPGYFQLCIYENIGKTNQPQEDKLRVVAAGERFSIEFQPNATTGQYDVYFFRTTSMEYWGTSRFRQRFSLFRRIGLWFGGTSLAPQEMSIRAGFSKDGL